MLLECANKAEEGEIKSYEMIIDEIRQKHFEVLTTVFQNDEKEQIQTEI